MPDPAVELEGAVLAALEPLAGRPSAGRAGGGRKYPQVSLGRTRIHDWSSGAETGEHLLTVHVRSKHEDEAIRLIELVRSQLQDGLDLGGGRALKLRLDFDEMRHDEEFAVHHGLLRFRAWIEENQR